jgi:sterol desaturase/sphingolipid hydroxylase (fatty acid hydroxylase superfamily)
MLPLILAVFAFCFVLERLIPGWRLPRIETWPLRVIAINVVQLGVVLLAGVSWERWLSSRSLFHLSAHVPNVIGGFIAYFIATFIFYWWHRWRHEADFLWLGFHQIHHSPQRIEVITSFYKHPAIYTACTALGEFFYHTNIRTPRWVGFIFQRPEMHRIHHEYGRHKNNYGDFVWWDMLFGTYENPETFASSCGFDDAREQQLLSMLAFRDVHREESAGA